MSGHVTGVREAVLYQYVFLAMELESPSGRLLYPEDSDSLTSLHQAVRCLHDWLGRPLDPAQLPASLSMPAGRREESVIYPVGGQVEWLFAANGLWAGHAYARLKNGALVLQLAYARTGEADAEARARLAATPWTPPDDAAFTLGQTLCCGGRVADLAAATAAADLALPADPRNPLPLRRADLPWGGWLFDRPGLPDRLALLYPDTDAAERLASGLVNRVLPDLALSLHKIAHQYGRGYEQALRPLLAERERALAAVLARAHVPQPDVDRLEGQLQALADAYNAFAADLAAGQRLAQAVRVNLFNLRQTFSEHDLPREGPLAVRLTAAERALQQLEADDGFYRARVHQAQMALAALQVGVDIERAHLEQEENRQAERHNLLLGFIGMVLALGQIVTDEVVLAFLRRRPALFGRVPVEPAPVGMVFGVKLLLVLLAGVAGIGLAWALGRLWRGLRAFSSLKWLSRG